MQKKRHFWISFVYNSILKQRRWVCLQWANFLCPRQVVATCNRLQCISDVKLINSKIYTSLRYRNHPWIMGEPQVKHDLCYTWNIHPQDFMMICTIADQLLGDGIDSAGNVDCWNSSLQRDKLIARCIEVGN